MINGNNQYWQNAAINIRKDNDEWKNAANIYPPPVLIEKSVTENGDYIAATDNADGYSSVKVEVPSGSEAFEVIIEVDNFYNVTSISKTFSETIQKLNSGEYVKFTFQIPHEGSTLAGGYSTLFNGTTHEFDGILIFFMGGYIEGQMTCDGFKWNSDDTYVNQVYLMSEPTT